MIGASNELASALYVGNVAHARPTPAHAFTAPIYLHLFDLDEVYPLDRSLRLFGYNRRRPVALWDADHLGNPDLPIRENLCAYLKTQGYQGPTDRVLLLTQCRVMGYVFNPISLFYCLGPAGEIAAVVAEVHNTYGELHPYLLHADGPTGGFRGQEKKAFHVSPFMTLDGTYRFAISPPPPAVRIDVQLDLLRGGAPTFTSRLSLRRVALTERSLLGTLVRYPLMPQRVIASIYWQALQLWRKRAVFHPKPTYDPVSAREGTAS